jgi:signal transduction histidine kinase
MTSPQLLQGDTPYKVLVIEDNPQDRALYKRLLSRSNMPFEIYEVATVSDGLKLNRKENVDCILVDYRLPDADGIEFIKSCKEEGLRPDAAIVMVTGQGSEQTAVEAMKQGALDYIAKNTIIEGFFVQSILNAIERAHLKRQVRQYQDALEKSYLALSDFTHTVSHDLKAPLRRIAQYCDILKEEMGDRLGVEGTDYVTRLGVSARRLQNLVDDLLTYSVTLSAKEEKSNLNFQKMADEVIDDLKILIKENNATVITENLPIISGYQVRLKELLQNLIENALKYRNKANPVITISCQETETHYLFSVKDNGKGIEQKYHESIFKPFERLHTQEEIEGTGLGLSICSKVVEIHDGKIWVESRPGQGSEFKFIIPRI